MRYEQIKAKLGKQYNGVGLRGVAVRSWLRDGVSKVDTLAETVARLRSLWWGNPQSLGQDTHKVGQTGTLKEERKGLVSLLK